MLIIVEPNANPETFEITNWIYKAKKVQKELMKIWWIYLYYISI